MPSDGEWVEPLVPGYESLSAVLATVSAYLLVTTFETALAAGLSIPILSMLDLTSVLPVPLTLVLGSVALWAIPIGYVLGDLLSGAIGPGTLVGASVHLYLGYSTAKLLRWFEIDTVGSASTLLRRGTVVRFVLAIGVAGTGAAAVAGWMSEVVRAAPFFVAAPVWFAELVGLNLVCSVPLVGVFRWVAGAVENQFGIAWYRPSDLHGRFELRRVALVSLTWLFIGVVASVGYRSLERLPENVLAGHGFGVLPALVRPDLFGSGAGRVQVLVGAVLVSVLLASYAAKRPQGNGEGVRL